MPALLDMTRLDSLVKSVHSADRTRHSPTEVILKVHEVWREAKKRSDDKKSDICQKDKQDSLSLAALTSSEHKHITAARRVELGELRKTAVLCSIQEPALIEVHLHEMLAKHFAYNPAHVIVVVYPSRFFYISFVSFCMVEVNLPRH